MSIVRTDTCTASIVTRSLSPLPARTITCSRARPTSLTRSRRQVEG